MIVTIEYFKPQARRARDEEKPAAASPSRESIGTSVEVQTAHSCDIFSIKAERDDVRRALRRRTGAQVLKIQVEFDSRQVKEFFTRIFRIPINEIRRLFVLGIQN